MPSRTRTALSRRRPRPVSLKGGIQTEALPAQIAVAKYADGLPLYRQEAIYARDHVELDRQLMAQWMGKLGFYAVARRVIFERFLTDGRVELDSNFVERAIRPQTITRKNSRAATAEDEPGRPSRHCCR